MHEEAKTIFGQRLRRLRHQQGLTVETVAANAQCHHNSWRGWEAGRHAPVPWRLGFLARGLGVPVSALFDDEAHIADVTLSQATLEGIRRGGREQSRATADRLASLLEPLIWQAATMPAVDLRPGARAARKRKTRREVLAGARAAKRASERARLRRRSEIA